MFKIFFKVLILFLILSLPSKAQVISNIDISGNDRISDETIKMFTSIKIDDDINDNDLNEIIKRLYDTNFFKNVSVSLLKNSLLISVQENPLINTIVFEGIKSNKLKEKIQENLYLKPRYSYNEFFLKEDLGTISTILKANGYYFSTVDVFKELNDDQNQINIIYKIDVGNKTKIKKIAFTGNKIYKDNKLKSLIISEEYKPWKFISGKKYLNESTINFDLKLLKNFYLNKGYYNVEINSSFARLFDEDNFELIFNINSNEKYYFNNLELILPQDFSEDNFSNIEELFEELKNKPYSLVRIKSILNNLDKISTNEQFESVKSTVEETIVENKIDLKFIIEETEKIFVEKINIFGNNITRESVLRNRLEVDEGDPFNEILVTKSKNNIKSLNFFKDVKFNTRDNDAADAKIIDIIVEEKATGEIMAGAGVGTGGSTITAGVKENNYLGKGIAVNTNLTLTEDSIRGIFSVINPNYKNSDKSLYTRIEALDNDRLSTFGYKTNKTGVSFGTNFEYYNDLNLGLGINSFYETIETDSTASALQKKQTGNYFDNFLNVNFDYDKRDQTYQTTDGFRNYFSTNIPLLSESNTLTNTFIATSYHEFLEKNVFKSSFYFKSSNSLTGDNIKLSERNNIPSKRLRGFEFGKVGPKDGNDYIGGNFVTSANFSSSLPQLFENSQSTDFSVFLDIANIWGVDYNTSLDKSDNFRSSVGINLDWFSVLGPLSFSLSQPITKQSSDVTETFRFNIGTTF